MKGTAVLFQDDHSVTILENVDKTVYEELRTQTEQNNNSVCKIDNREINLDSVSPVMWCEDQIDWDYGY